MDEIDLRRFLGRMVVTANEVKGVADGHPDGPVRDLCKALHELMMALQPERRLSGPPLYAELGIVLKSQGSSWDQLAQELEYLPQGRLNVQLDTSNVVPNFPPRLVPVLLRGYDYPPLERTVHLVNDGSVPELRIWWRRTLAAWEEWPAPGPTDPPFHLRPSLLVLDATAEPSLLVEAFEAMAIVTPSFDIPDWPVNVRTHQYIDSLVGRSTMDLYPEKKALSDKGVKTRRRWYGRVVSQVKDLPGFSPDWTVGLITFKGIQDRLDMNAEAKQYLDERGIHNVKTLHYYGLRGSNDLEHVKVLVLLGCPIPSPGDFMEEVEAFFSPVPPLWGKKGVKKQDWLTMRDGKKEPVTVWGYEGEEVQSYFHQKCQSELYQAVHRIRPYLVKPEDERFVLIYTRMPIPDVEVDQLLRSEEAARIQGRTEAVVKTITDILAKESECPVPQLAELVAAAEGTQKRTVAEWIRQNANELAKATDSVYEPGNRGRSARFARQS